MRRISIQYAQPGNVLARDVYDNFGNMLVKQGSRITLENMDLLGRLGGGEIFIRDARVSDIPVTSMIPGYIQAEARRSLREFLYSAHEAIVSKSSEKISHFRLEKSVYSMVKQLYPAAIGDVNVSSCYAFKDYNFAHPVQVAEMALAMGRKLGYNQTQLVNLGMASLLMNTGYTALPEGLLDEQTMLSVNEWKEIKKHPEYGVKILKIHTKVAPSIFSAVLEHHERWDGSGYPRGLSREAICLDARVIAIADIYYALVPRRPFRPANGSNEAIEYIMAYSNVLFEPELVNLFLSVLHPFPVGVMVGLNTGESGIVVGWNTGMSIRPKIRICYDRDQKEVQKPFDIDLSKTAHGHQMVVELFDY